MKKQHLLLIAFLFVFGLNQTFAQASPKVDTLFYNANGILCFKEDANIYRIRQLGDTIFVKDYDVKLGYLVMEGAFLDLQARERVGKFTGFYKNGTVKYKANYEATKQHGFYQEFHESGIKKLEGSYFQGSKKGEWKEYDSLGNLYALDNYVKDKLSGESFTYYPSKQIKRKEFYVDGKKEEAQCFTEDGKDTTYFPRFELPEFPGGMEELYKFLGKSIKYPPLAREQGIEGKVMLTFVVEKTGVLANIEVAYNPNQMLSDEAMRVIKQMPPWKPGKTEGEIVRVKFTLPVRFQLN